MNENKKDLIIIGGGPAGLTAAIYSSRAALDTLVIEGSPHGGQLTITSDVENFPGFQTGVLGPQLIENMREQAQRFGSKLYETNVTKISGSAATGFDIETESGGKFMSKAVIIASGASAKWLGLSNETRLLGKGVSACATCDGFFFKDKEIAVVGGGDSAMEEALFLTKFAKKVTVLVRAAKEQMRASKIMQNKAFTNPKIEFMFETNVLDVLGEDKVKGLKIATKTGEQVLPDIEGLFVAIGHSPNTKFLEGFVELDVKGYVKVTDNTKTSVPGVFVAGDVSDFRYRQAVTAAGVGCMAALDAEKHLAHQ